MLRNQSIRSSNLVLYMLKYSEVYCEVNATWIGLQGWQLYVRRLESFLRIYVEVPLQRAMPTRLRTLASSLGCQTVFFLLSLLLRSVYILGMKSLYACRGQPDYKMLYGPHTKSTLRHRGLSLDSQGKVIFHWPEWPNGAADKLRRAGKPQDGSQPPHHLLHPHLPDVGVNLRGADALMAQQGLDVDQVRAGVG